MKFNFLNYRPVLEDEVNPGLNVAQNVVHEVEGYKPIHLRSAGAFVTAIPPNADACVAKSVGSQGDIFAAWLLSNELIVGVNGITSTSVTTGYPLSFSTAGTNRHIYSFDVCEAFGRIFFTVEARQSNSAPATTEALVHSGYLDFT